MAKRRSVGKREDSLPPIGETREEVQQTLMETMRGVLDGRITVKQANRITHAASVQLYLLRLMGQLERRMERERKSKCVSVEELKRKKGSRRWVN